MIPFQAEDAIHMTVILATLTPLVAFLLIMLGTRARKNLSAGLSLGAIAISFGCSLLLLARLWNVREPLEYSTRWVALNRMEIPFGFLLDPVSLLMLSIVTLICLLVQVYSLGYMAGDPGFSRYYAFMSLFAWAMTSLVLSSSLLQLFIFWELVGLSSYLLIGFWYEKFSATQAGKKAFVMTRAGDVSFLLGLILVLVHVGNPAILEMNSLDSAGLMPSGILTFAALLIFGGIVGKSAQFPLMTWLPDAMEGPTPVSALLHSATMVAAGVYLFARLFPFFALSPTAMGIFLFIGTVSMILASTMAMVARDIKQVWAYSTISQLGFMIMGLAAGGYFAGVFHLTTHAGFKALLFLCSGVFIHTWHTNDIFELGKGGARRLKIPVIALVVAAGALAGLPPFSGFFSKEAILAALALSSHPVWLAAGLLGVFLTAYYAFRVLCILLFPPSAGEEPSGPVGGLAPAPKGSRQEGSSRTFIWPLIILAFLTLLLGFFQGPLQHFLLGEGKALLVDHGEQAGWLPFTALFLSLAGVGLAWAEFGRCGAARLSFVERIPFLRELFSRRWYLDHFYHFFVDRIVDRGFSKLFAQNDNRVIDGSIEAVSRGTLEAGRFLAFLQSGMIQYRLLVSFAVMVLLSLYFFYRDSGGF